MKGPDFESPSNLSPEQKFEQIRDEVLHVMSATNEFIINSNLPPELKPELVFGNIRLVIGVLGHAAQSINSVAEDSAHHSEGQS